MTKTEYLIALEKLGYRPQSKALAEALGLSRRHLGRLARGEQPIPVRTEKLIFSLLANKANRRD